MPPLTVTEALPELVPQLVLVLCVVALKTVGWVITTFIVCWQLFTSVTVQVYVPALKLVAVAAVPPTGDHE